MNKLFVISLLTVAFVGVSCPNNTEQQTQTQTTPTTEAPSQQRTSEPTSKDTTSAPAPSTGFSGNVLVNATTPVLEFNRTDYDKAVAEGKLVVLTFYATWCPICGRQQPIHFDAMRNLNNPDVVAFRVNYKDGDTSAEEEQIAREMGIAFQDTKCIVKDGQRVVKSTEFWSTDRYASEIANHI